MTDTATPATAAPAATATAPASSAPAPAPDQQTLFGSTPPAATPTGTTPSAPGTPDDLSWLPEKYRVNSADGKIDLAASARKLGDGYGALSKKLGTGDVPPASPDAYTFTPDEKFKDIALDAEMSKAFRERAHQAGLTQKQYEFVMGEYFGMVPAVLDGAARASVEEARTELQKVWKTSSDFEAGMSSAERAVGSMPADLQAKIKERYGTDPVFWQFAAAFGKEMRESTPPATAAPANPADQATIEGLMASPAYSDPKHPEHKLVNDRVQAYFKRRYGESAAA